MKVLLNDQSYQSVYTLGNGSCCAYGVGPNIFQMLGPHYSAPTVGSLKMLGESITGFETKRETNTCIFSHEIFEGEISTGYITDFVAADSAVLIRKFSLNRNYTVLFACESDFALKFLKGNSLPKVERDCWVVEVPAGAAYYAKAEQGAWKRGFVTRKPCYMAMMTDGEAIRQGNQEIAFCIGDSKLVCAFDEDLIQAILTANQMFQENLEYQLDQARAYWKSFTNRRRNNRLLKDELEQCADDVAVMIKAQQSKSGGIFAGYNYRLAYIRDNYGVHRGLLALGCYEEARALLQYYGGIFQRNGLLHNAQGTDLDDFHIHENDYTEITGYMALMPFEYVEKTGDTAIFFELMPLILWCINVQHSILKNGMLPFNGDETYIAGELIPRTVINDGSAEATALYHAVLCRALQHSKLLNLPSALVEQCEQDKKEIEETFVSNFIIENKLTANQPNYYDQPPVYRHGVRFCGHSMGACVWKDGVYVCPFCCDKDFSSMTAQPGQRYTIISPWLMCSLIGSSLLPQDIWKREVEQMCSNYLKEKKLPSCPDANKTVGYDYGLLIQACRMINPRCAAQLTDNMLAVRDDIGMWCEYYVNDQPEATKCRPWESGLNIEALLG